MELLTVEEVRKALPASLKNVATQGLVDALNGIQLDPEEADAIRGNFITYTSVLSDGKFKITDYMNAVVFVSYRLMQYTNNEAYQKTFPDRYMEHVQKGTSSKTLSSYISAYANNKLVNLILEQSLIPTWVLNQDKYQEAINTQFFLMQNAKSEMVKMQAANSILHHLKKPESKEFQLNLNIAEDRGLEELRNTMNSLAQTQLDLLGEGVATKTITHQKIVPTDSIDDAELV